MAIKIIESLPMEVFKRKTCRCGAQGHGLVGDLAVLLNGWTL